MSAYEKETITFALAADQINAIEKLSGSRKVRLSGSVKDGKLVIDNIGFADKEFSQAVFVPVNAPFKTAQLATA